MSALFQLVSNRGSASPEFIRELVAWAKSAPEEIFSEAYKSASEADIYQWLHGMFATEDRRAVMCEVLRVLAGFESSWKWSEGVDVTNPSSNTPLTEEAGIFQISANSMYFDQSLRECFRRYGGNLPSGRTTPDEWGSKVFIQLTKSNHTFAFEYCARLLRFTIRHHGPLVRRDVFQHMNRDAIREFTALLGGKPTPTPKPDPIPEPTMSMAKNNYTIDAGHGGHDSGAVSGQFTEKSIVLAVAKKLRDMLALDLRFAGKVKLTRETDVYLSLTERAAIANRNQAILFSIHANSGGGTGFECFTTPGQTESDKLATAALEAYKKDIGSWLVGRYDMQDGDPDKEARFTVLTQTTRAAILFELGFMDRASDLAFMTGTAGQDAMARALYRGILKYEGMSELVEPTPVATPAPVTPPVVLPTPTPVTPDDATQALSQQLHEKAGELEAEAVSMLTSNRISEAYQKLGLSRSLRQTANYIAGVQAG